MRSLWLGILACAAMFVACGDDDSDFATRPSDGKESSSSKVPEPAEWTSSSVKSSSSAASSSSTKDVILSNSEGSSDSKSGSSEKVESSSSKVPEPAGGTLTDSRDGQTYKTVKIGTQTWMAENLNYTYNGVPYNFSGNFSDSTSWCYGNDPANCAKYGRLYTWAAAMDSVGMWSTNGKDCGYNKMCSPTYPVRGVCPEGWHLPTYTEWNTLFTAVGVSSTAGEVLKSTSGWDSSGNGTDAFGFSALPAGGRDYNGNYYGEDNYALFWSSSERGSGRACNTFLIYSNDCARIDNDFKNYAFSVRCVKD
ncbi:fibrobacter succinogenes major paralogous domain-containing protein [Fibrobacter sp. UBA2449]|uniref:fibrobacter succinogenes major paralogous domain-containing protein n=1 Tax=Fibrobacter sp. UBA2449 TaxID=1946529 RepID=UPI0025BBB314|nr:fibrobacter succinogenes major paralogous domain-containing protein [Fibrobacter sp. UBA2449]